MTDEEFDLAIPEPDADARAAAAERLDALVKPEGSLGRLESAAVDVAGMTGDPTPSLDRAAVVVAAGDHAVADRGVSAYPQSVTRGMLRTFLDGGAAVSALAGSVGGVEPVVVDAGVASDGSGAAVETGEASETTEAGEADEASEAAEPTEATDSAEAGVPDGAVDARVRPGGLAGDIAAGPAMTRAEAVASVREGLRIAREHDAVAGADVVALGEMGIANTTPSAALTVALAGVDPETATGRGTDVSAEGRAEKVRVVERALAANEPDPDDALDCLRRVGGFEHAVLAGVALGAAEARTPVVVDGHPTGAAALVAAGVDPRVRDYLLPSHASAETGHAAQLDALGLEPLFDYDMRLGEGTGAVLAVAHYRAACDALSGMATFEEAGL